MNVGIVTQPLYINYGGILQNYALQQVLKKLGHTPITLNYMPSLPFERYLLYVGKGLLFSLSPTKRHPIKPYRRFLERPSSIDSFVQGYINITKTIPAYSKKILRKNRIEALIAGSDQVWRYSYNSHYIKDMYLDFSHNYPCRNLAYGVSFGVDKWDYPESVTKKVKELVKKIDKISVRELSGVLLCREKLGVEAQLVLDPTMLLEASDYELFCTAPNPEDNPYLAAYVLDENEEKRVFIKTLARRMGLTIKSMTVSDSGCSIENWLSTIRNAAFVITDSYHGSLFSILFKRQFLTIANKERGADRFVTVFSLLGLSDRLLDSLADCSMKDTINYEDVEPRLNALRNTSLSFLQKALGTDEQ